LKFIIKMLYFSIRRIEKKNQFFKFVLSFKDIFLLLLIYNIKVIFFYIFAFC
jgi:hypothetical protein